jgi:hypothetical protein
MMNDKLENDLRKGNQFLLEIPNHAIIIFINKAIQVMQHM